jgi:hypothetical protein
MPLQARAEEGDTNTTSGINENGQVGGLHLPTARTLEAGSGYFGYGRSPFYEYAFAGLQPIEDLRLVIRETKDQVGVTYPGLDAQIQLLDESDWVPETALGLTHLVGQTRFAGEYLAFSKRFGDFDFSAGLGWGRYADNGAFGNPLSLHDSARDDGLGDEGPGAWFRGSRMGAFGGVTYQTPWERLQILAEFDRDPYAQEKFEQALFDEEKVTRRAPVNVGARVTLIPGLALTGGLDSLSQSQVYLTYTLDLQKENPGTWQMGYEQRLRPPPINDGTLVSADITQIPALAWQDNMALEKVTAPEQGIIAAHYRAGDVAPYAADLGHAAYAVADSTNADVVAITLVPEHDGLEGDTYTLLRRDVVRDTEFKGSAAEVMQTATVRPTVIDNTPAPTLPERPLWRLFTVERADIDPYEFTDFILSNFRLQLGGTYEALHGVTLGATGNYEVSNNYPATYLAPHPVRSDHRDYLNRTVDTENLYVNAMQTVAPGLHTRVTAGLLEQMYRGVSGEILYQPFQSRWAMGAEGDWLQQRSPIDDFAKTGFETTPAALSVYYEVLPHDLTIIARAEQFLAKDQGGTLEFQHQFLRGSELGFGATYSNEKDLGGLEYYGHWTAMMTLRVPLEYAIKNVPIENRLEANAGPVLRDSGAEVELPVRLWDATRPISYGPITNSWGDFLNF